MIVRSLVSLLLIIPLALAVACGDDDDGSGDDTAGATTPAESTTPPAASDAIEISAQDFTFVPASISATAGEEVTVTVTNDGAAAHTFTIDSADVDVQLGPGDSETVTFTPTGDEAFYCRFHRASGMEGTISTGAAAADPADGGSPTAGANEFSY